MKSILFAANLPSPYRVDFFNELGKHCQLTVCFERLTATDRDSKWKGAKPENFEAVYLGAKPLGTDLSVGLQLTKCIARHKEDVIILTNYVSPSTMIAILYCQIMRIPYYIEHDGGFDKVDPFLKGIVKRILLKPAKAHLTTCEQSISYLKSIGVPADRIHKYPFTSLKEEDIEAASIPDLKTKESIKSELGISDSRMVLYVGQLIHRKGIDILLRAAESLPQIGFYLVGGEPPKEYQGYVDEHQLANVHFIGFKNKDELARYYKAADMLVLPTREDIWGLVINEAMAYGLPCITTNRCIAGLELIRDGLNGYVVSSENVDALVGKIEDVLRDADTQRSMASSSLKLIQTHTIEKMAMRHIQILSQDLIEQ